jgi:hypothetical protein
VHKLNPKKFALYLVPLKSFGCVILNIAKGKKGESVELEQCFLFLCFVRIFLFIYFLYIRFNGMQLQL